MNVNQKLSLIMELIEAGVLTADQAYDMLLAGEQIDYPELKMENVEVSLP